MGLLVDFLKKRYTWWEHNWWKFDLILNIIFFSGLIAIMWYVVEYDCADVYDKCLKMCSHCNPNITIESVKGHMVNSTPVITP